MEREAELEEIEAEHNRKLEQLEEDGEIMSDEIQKMVVQYEAEQKRLREQKTKTSPSLSQVFLSPFQSKGTTPLLTDSRFNIADARNRAYDQAFEQDARYTNCSTVL